MRKKGVAGWWRSHQQSDSELLASPAAVEEVEVVLLLDCLVEEEVEVEEVGAQLSPPQCRSQWCGRGFQCVPPITWSPEQRKWSQISNISVLTIEISLFVWT